MDDEPDSSRYTTWDLPSAETGGPDSRKWLPPVICVL